MPVFNVASFVRESIDSILNQDFSDFEFIIIDDGSTDETASIVVSYTDARIRFLQNDENRGLVYTLNRGITEARGEYIARMDGDDICLPCRFSEQIKFLDANRGIAMLATRIQLIDEQGQPAGAWPQEVRHVEEKEIKKYLPLSNCIAHPTVMGRAEVFRLFGYREAQRASEDYDLWLRLLANHYRICKLPAVTLLHRVHRQSFMGRKKENGILLVSKVKLRFFWLACKELKMNKVVLMCGVWGLLQLPLGMLKSAKRAIA
jgi:glycosyltransferase involved in cell wall biosynthesis